MIALVAFSDFASVDAILGIFGIIIGLTIFLMQRKADSKINRIIETQFKRQELEKKYFGTRVVSNLQLVKRNHLKLAQLLSDHLKDHTLASRVKIRNFSTFQSTNVEEYIVPALRGDLGRLVEFIEDPSLVDQLSAAFDDFSSLFRDCSLESVLEGPEPALEEIAASARRRADEVESLLSRFTTEIQKTVD